MSVISLALLAACGGAGEDMPASTGSPTVHPAATATPPVSATPSQTASATPTPSPGTFEDGRHFVFVRGTAGDALIVDPAEMLIGDEAAAAAREDGVIGPNEDLPNDFYIRNPSTEHLAVPLAREVSIILIGFDVDGALEDRTVAIDEFNALLEGGVETDQYYGIVPGNLPAELVVAAGSVTQVVQQYLP